MNKILALINGVRPETSGQAIRPERTFPGKHRGKRMMIYWGTRNCR